VEYAGCVWTSADDGAAHQRLRTLAGRRQAADHLCVMHLAKIYVTTVAKLLDDRDYAAFTDKQLFEIIALDQGAMREVQPDAEPAELASMVVQEAESAVPSIPVGDGEPDMQQARRRKVLQAMGAVSGAMAASDYLDSIELGRQVGGLRCRSEDAGAA
jgi:hypothetical protein